MRQRSVALLVVGALLTALVSVVAVVAPDATRPAGATTAGGFTAIAPARVLDTRLPGQGPCAAGPRPVAVGGVAVPSTAVAVTVNVTAITASRAGFATVYPAGQAPPPSSTVNYTPGQVVANNAVVKLGYLGALAFFASEGCPHLLIDVTGYFTAPPVGPGGFVGLAPTRALDTRQPGDGPCVAGPRPVTLAGRFGVPATAAAVAVNVTVTGASAPGYLTAWPSGQPAPTASTVNFAAGQTVANGSVVRLGADGAVTVLASGGCPHLILDVTGYFTALPTADVGGTAALAPYRILDTRQPGYPEGCLRGYRAIPTAGKPGSGVPWDAYAVLVNITVVNPSAGGYLTAFPDLGTPPPTSILNFTPGQVVANMAWVPVNPNNQRITLYSSNGCPHVVLDVVGVVTTGTAPPPLTGTTLAQTPRAPVFPLLADPSVLTDAGRYYLFGSNTATDHIPVVQTSSLTTAWSLWSWDQATVDAMPTKPAWAQADVFWAPHVTRLASGQYVMFFAAKRPNPPQPWNPTCIGRAFAATPTGPYVPEATPFTCGIDGTGGALDPEVFKDPVSGGYTLLAAFGDTDASVKAIPLDASLNAPLALRQPTRATEIRSALAAQQHGDTTFLENPSMVYDPTAGSYVLTFSYGDWTTANYRTGLVRCSTPTGPCSLQSATAWLASGNGRVGPGGLSFFKGTDGVTGYAISASYTQGSVGGPRASSVYRLALSGTPSLLAP